MNAKNEYTGRFLEAIAAKGTTNQELIHNVDGLDKSLLSHIQNGRQAASIKLIIEFLNRYPDVNANYILTGNGSMFLSDEEEAAGEEEMRMLIKRLNTAYDEIERLQKELEEARTELARQKAV